MYSSFVIFPSCISAWLCSAFKVKAILEEVTWAKFSRTGTTPPSGRDHSSLHDVQLCNHVQPWELCQNYSGTCILAQ